MKYINKIATIALCTSLLLAVACSKNKTEDKQPTETSTTEAKDSKKTSPLAQPDWDGSPAGMPSDEGK